MRIHEIDEGVTGDGEAVVLVEGTMHWFAENRQSDLEFPLSFLPEGEEIVLALDGYYCEIAVSVSMSAEEGVGWGVRNSIRDGVNLQSVNLVALAKHTAHNGNNYKIPKYMHQCPITQYNNV
jgi:hypothetical protein